MCVLGILHFGSVRWETIIQEQEKTVVGSNNEQHSTTNLSRDLLATRSAQDTDLN